MFVSSYNTYINTNTSTKDIRSNPTSKDGNSKLFQKLPSHLDTKTTSSTTPANYISNTKALYNKQLIQSQQEHLKNKEENNYLKTQELSTKFSSISSLGSAKTAYSENSIMFSFLRKPHPTLNQTPQIDKKMPQELQKLQENHIRHNMLNTYLQNDKYYQITA